MRGFDRSERLANTLRRELADILRAESGDARFELLSISHVRISRDLSYADIYVVSLKAREADAQRALVQSLKSAAGFLRSRLASRARWIKVPALRFHYDELPERGQKLEALIDSVAPPPQTSSGSARQ